MSLTTTDRYDEESTGAEAMLERLMTSANARGDAAGGAWPLHDGQEASGGRR